jgi:hypothetical protein
MHESIERAAFGDQIAERLAHVAQLHRIGEFAVKVELRRHPARQDSVGPMIDEHCAPPLNGRLACGGGAHSFGPPRAGQ